VFRQSVVAVLMLGQADCEPMAMARVTVGGETVEIGAPSVEDLHWTEGVVASCMWLIGYRADLPVVLPIRSPSPDEDSFRAGLAAAADEATRRDPAALEDLWRDAEAIADLNRRATAYADGKA
jgi:hypothetical protein